MLSVLKLEQFRDLKLALSDLNESGTLNLFSHDDKLGVEYGIHHVIDALASYQSGLISGIRLFQWIYTIRWSELFIVCENKHDEVLNLLDDIIGLNKGGNNPSDQRRTIDITAIVNHNVVSQIKIDDSFDRNIASKFIEAFGRI
jgi:hypothetical protein